METPNTTDNNMEEDLFERSINRLAKKVFLII